ncbi:MAG: hypothetical protein EOO75_02400 [Myxococcales bacterium]|nr:MAG: hypothetical protein EOO75_02400 [Myxococcales bacterium]
MRTAITLLGAALALATPGCFAVTDLDRFEPDPAGAGGTGGSDSAGTIPYRDLRFTVRGMKPHTKHMFQYRVVTDQNIVVSTGRLVPFGPATKGPMNDPIDTLIEVPGGVPRGAVRLDFYADLDGTGAYEGVGLLADKKDHAWIIDDLNEPPPSVGIASPTSIDVTFSHNTEFIDINRDGVAQYIGLDTRIELTGTSALFGRLVEVRLINPLNKHTVGLHRFPQLDASNTSLVIEGMVEPEVDYDLEVYADLNGDGIYQDPTGPDGDGGWRTTVTATEEGVTASFDLSAPSSASVRFSYP